MAKKKVETKFTAKVAIKALTEAHEALMESTRSAQTSVLEIGRVWHLTCKVNKRKSPARDKVMEHALTLFGRNAATYLSNAARLYKIYTGLDKDIPLVPEDCEAALESSSSINPTALVKVMRDWYKDSIVPDDKGTDDKGTDDKTPEDKGTDTEPEPVEKSQPVNAEYATLTADEFSGTLGRCLNDAIKRLNDGWEPTPDTLGTLKKQIAKVGELLSDIKPVSNPLDKYLDKKVKKA
jgi:hypothetical protein